MLYLLKGKVCPFPRSAAKEPVRSAFPPSEITSATSALRYTKKLQNVWFLLSKSRATLHQTVTHMNIYLPILCGLGERFHTEQVYKLCLVQRATESSKCGFIFLFHNFIHLYASLYFVFFELTILKL